MHDSIKLYTIGFTKKNAETFFSLLKEKKVEKIIDVRLNNSSQLAGFAKQDDLSFFLKEICGIEYFHETILSPTEHILKNYKKKNISWSQYEEQFNKLLDERKPESKIKIENLNNACLLCSESAAENCHRRLVAEYFQKIYPNLEIIHLR